MNLQLPARSTRKWRKQLRKGKILQVKAVSVRRLCASELLLLDLYKIRQEIFYLRVSGFFLVFGIGYLFIDRFATSKSTFWILAAAACVLIIGRISALKKSVAIRREQRHLPEYRSGDF